MARLERRLVPPVRPRRHPEVLAHGQVGEDAPPARHVGDAERRHLHRRRAGDVPPVEQDLAALGRGEPGDGPQQRRLAGAVGAEHGEDLALVDVDADVEEDLGAAVGHLEADALEQRRAGVAAGVVTPVGQVESHAPTSTSSTSSDGGAGSGGGCTAGGAGQFDPVDPGHEREHPLAQAGRHLGQPAGQHQQHEQEAGAGDDHLHPAGQGVLGVAEEDGAGQRPAQRGGAAEHDHGEGLEAHGRHEAAGPHPVEHDGVQPSGQAGQRAADGEGGQLRPAHVDAPGGGRPFVVAHRHHRTARPGAADPGHADQRQDRGSTRQK